MDKPRGEEGGRQHHRDSCSTDVDWESEEERERPSLCCLQGCISATAVGVSFFLGLPTGILLVVQALNNNDDTTLLSIGIALIILPIFILIVVLLLCFNQKRLPNLAFWKKKNPQPATSKTRQPNQTDLSKTPSYRAKDHHNNNNINKINNNDVKGDVDNSDNKADSHDNNGDITHHHGNPSHVTDPPAIPVQSRPCTQS